MRLSAWWAAASSVVGRPRRPSSRGGARGFAAMAAHRESNNHGKQLPPPLWTVEWSPSVASVRSDLLPASPWFVFPDLPGVRTPSDREAFLGEIPPEDRIETVAVGAFSDRVSLVGDPRCQRVLGGGSGEGGRLLLVGGNRRPAGALTTTDAAEILAEAFPETHRGRLWGVADPNDPSSPEAVEAKIEAGIAGFLTQPLLSSTARRTLAEDYPRNNSNNTTTTWVVGLAMPRTARGLQFWCHELLTTPGLVAGDPLFRSHLAYFSQPHVVPLAWSGRELQGLLADFVVGEEEEGDSSIIDGVHFMPLGNTDDLVTIFRSLGAHHSRQ